MKKIATVVDNQNWCWSTTAKNTAVKLPGYKFTFFTNEEFINELSKDDFSKYDLVWFRGYSSAAMNEMTVKRLKCKFISTIGTGGKKLELRLKGAERTSKEGLGLIVQNQMAVHAAYKKGYDNVWMIANGVNNQLFHPGENKNKSPIIGMAANTYGSRADLKGVPFVKKAVELLGYAYKEVNAELPLSHEDMADWYRTIDYYLQPSDTEGCSNSVMEAMASGLPVFICEGVGYHGEICRSAIDYHDGQVIFVRRNEKDIADKIKILEDNPYIKQRCIDNALLFAQNHDWKHIAPQYKKMFDEVLGMKKKPSKAVRSGFSVGKTYHVRFKTSFRQKNGKKRIGDHCAILREDEYEAIKDKCEVIK